MKTSSKKTVAVAASAAVVAPKSSTKLPASKLPAATVNPLAIEALKAKLGVKKLSRKQANEMRMKMGLPTKTALIYAYNPTGADAPAPVAREIKREHQMGEWVIEVLAEENPRREGTLGWASFELLKTGMTVKEFMAAGGRTRDLWWDVKAENVELHAPGTFVADDSEEGSEE